MRSPRLFLPALVVPLLLFARPAAAVDILPSCCVLPLGEGHPPDGHPEDTLPPSLVPAEVTKPDERALKAAAEAPLSKEAPLAVAIAIPEEKTPRVPVPVSNAIVPERPVPVPTPPPTINQIVPVAVDTQRAASSPPRAQQPLTDPHATPAPTTESPFVPTCCQSERDSDHHDHHPTLVARPVEPRRHMAMITKAEVAAAALLILLAIGLWIPRPRRRRERVEDRPTPPREFPDELPLPDASPLPLAEPEVVFAKSRRKGREFEPA